MKPLQVLCSLALFASATLFLSSHAIAADPNAPPQRIVKFGDLNLDHPDGVKALYGRIAAAANAVCHATPSAPYAIATNAAHKCVTQAIAKAVADVNNRNLTAYYKQKTGGGPEDKYARR
jgi:UrcA family protein